MAFPRPSGLASAIVGGVLGAGCGLAVSYLISEQLKEGDLSDIGTGLVLLLAGLLIGPSAGAAIALAIRKHDGALVTGLLAGPLVIAAMIVGFVVLSRVRLSDDVMKAIGQPVLAALGIGGLWLARFLATR